MTAICQRPWFSVRSARMVVIFAFAAPLFSGMAHAEDHKLGLKTPRNFSEPPAASASVPTAATIELRREQEQLLLENGIAEQRLKKELRELHAEKQRRELESSLANQRLHAESATMQAESERLNRQIDLLSKRAALKEAERKARLETELGETREKLEKARAANELATTEVAARRRELDQLNAELELREKRDYWKNRVNTEMHYAKEPFQNGILTISDRRIALNGVISAATARQVAERVHYFNNQSRELPIFLVIDSSPGGSVQAGYQILKTMQGSPAPVYVVVKSFAASMAACLTTLAKRSFAYPNAVLLHHQMYSLSIGNMTEQREAMKEKEEWWKRLAAPLAAKMGIGLDELVRRMYKHRSSGDWKEFADAARKLKWVDEVVEVIREESYVKNPDAPPPVVASHPLPPLPLVPALPPKQAEATADPLSEQLDAQGRRYVALPRLDPIDAYYLYNPDGYYRTLP